MLPINLGFFDRRVSAWRALRNVDGPATWKALKTGVIIAAVLAPVQIFIGDLHGLNTLEHQPAKIAAMEAVWETEKGAPFTIVALPDEASKTNRYAIEVPYAASFILTHDPMGEVKGLNEFEGEHPPVAMVFWSFRVMLAMGGLMLLVSWWAAWQLRGKNTPTKPLLYALSAMTFSGWIAVLAGWYVTEIGRQPWIVTGVLKVQDVVADHSSATVGGTLIGYILLYGFLLASYIGALLNLSRKPAASLKLTAVSAPQTVNKEV